MSRYWKAALPFLLAAVIILAAASRPVVLHIGFPCDSYWNVPGENYYTFIDAAIEKFEAEHPNVKVEYTSGIRVEDYTEWLSGQYLLGQEPDVMVILPEGLVIFSDTASLRELDPFMKQDPEVDLSGFYPAALQAGADKGMKFRNTARYCLGNLDGFDAEHLVAPEDMLELDRWAVTKLNELIRTAFEAYDNYEFHVLTHAINDFCVVELSSFYLDILKDRLYCESRNGLKRRSAQTALYLIVDAMARMFAPILPFTCDEIWQAMPHRAGDDVRNVVLNEMVQPYEAYALDAAAMARWDTLIALRGDVNGVLEQARADKRIGKALEAHVALCARDEAAAKALETVKDMDLTALLLVSDVILTDDDPDAANVTGSGTAFPGLRIEVRNAEGVKCPRCWMHSTKANADGLCPRCAAVMAELDLGE